jgi:zinc transporter ZupT
MKSPIAALALALLASACSSTGAASDALALTHVSSGALAESAGATEGVVRTRAGWEALWSRLDTSGAPAPQVDFAREMVVYVARPGGAVAIERAVPEDGFLRIELREGSGEAYHAVSVPRSEAPVQFAAR